MSIDFHSAVLITENLGTLKHFYVDVLAQRVTFDFGNCVALECGLSLWQLKDEYPIAKAQGTTYCDTANKNMEICFETDTFDAEISRLKAHGVPLLHDIVEETWGQMTIRFYDPDSNLVELGESMPCFCRRLYKDGLSIEQIAEKTGIPMDAVEAYVEAPKRQ